MPALEIGYIGIGLMGLPMVRLLRSKGHTIAACDIVPERIAAAVEAGARAAATPAEAVQGVGIIILNLPTTEAVEAAVFGPDGVASVMKPPQVLVDFSTISVEKGKAFAAKLLERTGCGWVDAPVSGGPPASGSGTLTVMAGGRPEDIEAVRPLMAEVSQRFTPMGPSGAGLVAKMINQLIVGCTHAVLAEALTVAEKAGIDAAKLPECLSGGHADGTLLRVLYPRMAARNFAPQGYARQLLKDLEMVSSFAGGLKAPVPMTGEALNLYRLLIHLGHAELDTSAIAKLYGS